MNKDFFTKPISLKDIKLNEIDFKKLKNIKNKKEIVIGILILVYVIVIFCVGNSLLNARADAKSQYEIKERKYLSLLNAKSEEEIKEDIEALEAEKEKLYGKITEVENNNELIKIFDDFKAGAPISWEQQEINLKPETKEYSDYDVYGVSVNSFSGTFEDVEKFLDYVDNYDKIVRIDSIGIGKNQITGKMSGQLKMSFYFKKFTE